MALWRQWPLPRTGCRTYTPPSLIISGRLIAAELTETLSAPARGEKVLYRTDAPAYGKGNKDFSATRLTISSIMPLASEEAVISSSTSSSAPLPVVGDRRFYRIAGIPQIHKAGAFTTLPFFISRHGIILLACIQRSSLW